MSLTARHESGGRGGPSRRARTEQRLPVRVAVAGGDLGKLSRDDNAEGQLLLVAPVADREGGAAVGTQLDQHEAARRRGGGERGLCRAVAAGARRLVHELGLP